MTTDVLAPVRDALARHDWSAALSVGSAAAGLEGVAEAERLDLVAEASWWLGQLDDCIAAREAAYRLFEDAGDTRRAGLCAACLFEHHSFRARPSIAGGWLRRARRALGDDPRCVEHGSLLMREAEQAHGSGELDRALDLTSQAIDLGRALGSTDLEAEGLQAKGRVLIDQGDVTEGLGHLDEAMLFAVEGRLGPYATGKVYCSLVSACEEVGDLDRAAEWTEATMSWAERNHPFAIFPGICRVHRAVVLKRRGSLAEAATEAARACDELRSSHIGNTAAAYAEVGDILRRLGELDQAEDAFAHAAELAGRPCGALALLRLAQGRVEEASSVVDGCLRATANPLARSALLPMHVHVAIAAGDLDAADASLRELQEVTATFATPLLGATELSTRGRLELARCEASASATLHQAAERWQALEIPYEVATAHTLLGQALRAEGDMAAATASFEVAAGLFAQIGAHLDARLARGDDSKPSLPAGLTEREVEVLRLIAAGKTNNEVAAELYLSAKTVSRHLSNIFTKIGVSSRAGATAFAFEHRLLGR